MVIENSVTHVRATVHWLFLQPF